MNFVIPMKNDSQLPDVQPNTLKPYPQTDLHLSFLPAKLHLSHVISLSPTFSMVFGSLVAVNVSRVNREEFH